MTTTVNSNFVQSLYLNVLQRIGTADEVNGWVTQANSGLSAPDMVNSFISSADSNRVESIIRLYDAFFNRSPDSDGLYYWTNQYNSGSTLREIAVGFGNSPEFQNRFTEFSTAEFVETIYNNLYNRESDPDGKAFWVNQVDSGVITRTDVALFFAESPEALSSTGSPTRSAESYLVLRAAGNLEPTTEQVDALSASTLSEAVGENITSYTPRDDASIAEAEAAAVAASAAATEAAAAAAAAVAAAAASGGGGGGGASTEAAVAAAVAAAAAQAAAAAAALAAVGQTYLLTAAVETIPGTTRNDTFISTYDDGVVTDTFNPLDNIDGISGIDTLVVNHFIDTAITPPDTLWTNIRNIDIVNFFTTGAGVQTLTTGTLFNTAFSSSGVTLSLITAGGGAINVDMTSFTGIARINSTSLAGAQVIITGTGDTTVNASSAAGALTIYGRGLEVVTAVTTGAGAQTIGNAGTGGENLVSVTANSNGGAQTITSTSNEAVTITSISVTNSINTISATGTGVHTITAGSGIDLITGGIGVDTFTGGLGIDTFAFGASGSIIGAALDVITDFQSIDVITFGATGSLISAGLLDEIGSINAGGLITFDGVPLFAAKVSAIQSNAELDVAGSVAMFIDAGNTYVYYAGVAAGNADDQLVQLTGVTGVAITAGATTTITLV